jgi:3-keto-disaccharide hydrolase
MQRNIPKLILLTWILALFAGLPSICMGAEKLPLIFNGKDFSGWKVPEENIWWKVDQGILKVQSGPNKKGSTLWTEKEYTDFVMTFQYKNGAGHIDSGVYLRNSKQQIQIGISGSLKRDMTASPYIAGKGYPVEAQGVKELLKPDDWNHMKIEARGKQYTVWLNGKQVMSYQSDTAIAKGPVGIQLHGNCQMAIDYRDIRLAELE